MSKPAKTVFIFGIYLAILGTVLITVPNALLSAFAIESTHEVWIRVVGMLVLILALYYTQAARLELISFIWLTVWARMMVIFFFTVFVLSGLAPPTLLLFGAVDFLAALWTWSALRRG